MINKKIIPYTIVTLKTIGISAYVGMVSTGFYLIYQIHEETQNLKELLALRKFLNQI